MNSTLGIELGLIEGFYGRPWPWRDRTNTVAFLSTRGYGFYIYAPKADVFLRRRWSEAHPERQLRSLARLAGRCRALDVRFGIGLSPYGAFENFDRVIRNKLARKLALLDDLGVEYLTILFDDMPGGICDLAKRQAELMDWVCARTTARRIIVCPTYYSDDPVLDQHFGARPENYLRDLGLLLPPSVDIFWTGPHVCAREVLPAHLERVAEELGRRPFLWDNYPVNDGPRMSQYLHVMGFSGRPSSLRDGAVGHAINPSLQPVLARIPALTLVESYECANTCDRTAADARAAQAVLGDDLGSMVVEDAHLLQMVGLDRLGPERIRLRQRYARVDHPGAREITAWLDGAYRITDEAVRRS